MNTNGVNMDTPTKEVIMADKTVATSIRIPESLKKKIEEKAKKEGRTLNNMMNRILEEATS